MSLSEDNFCVPVVVMPIKSFPRSLVTGIVKKVIIAEINMKDGETTIYKIINKTKNRATRNPTKNRD
jgi:hypothetical protein